MCFLTSVSQNHACQKFVSKGEWLLLDSMQLMTITCCSQCVYTCAVYYNYYDCLLGVFPVRQLPIRRLPICRLPICQLNKNCPHPYRPYGPKRSRGWSYYYMHSAAPIMQYMAASTQFNPLSQQIIIYVRSKTTRTDVIRNVCSITIQ